MAETENTYLISRFAAIKKWKMNRTFQGDRIIKAVEVNIWSVLL